MARRILFLDIDGVLNGNAFLHRRWVARGNEPVHRTEDARWLDDLDPECVKRLDRLVREADCEVVISSSWRVVLTHERIAGFLKTYGFGGKVIDATTTDYPLVAGRAPERGDQIALWMAANGVTDDEVVILDDSCDIQPLLHRHLRTDALTGLTEGDVNRALAMFGVLPPRITDADLTAMAEMAAEADVMEAEVAAVLAKYEGEEGDEA